MYNTYIYIYTSSMIIIKYYICKQSNNNVFILSKQTMYNGCGVAGNVLTILFINRLGKRFLALSTMAICSICYLSIGAIGNFWPSSPISSWMKIVLFFMSTFFSSMGITPVVWILMGELFPMK